MASLSIKNLDSKVYEQLRMRAAFHGVSVEEEACRIISQAVGTPVRINDVFRKYFGDKNGIDLELSDPHLPHSPIEIGRP